MTVAYKNISPCTTNGFYRVDGTFRNVTIEKIIYGFPIRFVGGVIIVPIAQLDAIRIHSNGTWLVSATSRKLFICLSQSNQYSWTFGGGAVIWWENRCAFVCDNVPRKSTYLECDVYTVYICTVRCDLVCAWYIVYAWDSMQTSSMWLANSGRRNHRMTSNVRKRARAHKQISDCAKYVPAHTEVHIFVCVWHSSSSVDVTNKHNNTRSARVEKIFHEIFHKYITIQQSNRFVWTWNHLKHDRTTNECMTRTPTHAPHNYWRKHWNCVPARAIQSSNSSSSRCECNQQQQFRPQSFDYWKSPPDCGYLVVRWALRVRAQIADDEHNETIRGHM